LVKIYSLSFPKYKPSNSISSKILLSVGYSVQQYGIEVSHTKTMENMLKRRQGAEVKEEDQEKRSQEDKSDKPHDLGIIHPA
jgi:hypothetical protein